MVGTRCSSGWLTSRCQTTAHIPSVCGVTRSAATVGMSDAGVGHRPGGASIPADDAEDAGAHLARELERAHQIHAHVLLAVPPAHREHQHAVALAQARPASHSTKQESQPSSFTRAVSSHTLSVGRVGLEAAELPEVVDRVAGVAGAPPDAEHEEASAVGAHAGDRPVATASMAAGSSLAMISALSARYRA